MGANVVQQTDIVIIGCGASGGTAAQFARKTNRKAHITIIEKSRYPQYSKCGLPYVLSGDIPQLENLIEFPESWFQKAKIDLKLNTTVETIQPQKNQIQIKQNSERRTQHYDKLIIATGANPKIPDIPAIYKNNELAEDVHVIRTITDIQHIKKKITPNKKVTIVGAGLIGIEMTDALTKKNIDATLIEALPHILMNTLDTDMSKTLLETIKKQATVMLNHTITDLHYQDNNLHSITLHDLSTKKQTTLPTELLILAIGSKPNTTLAKNAGCNIGATGGIVINNKTETSLSNIYATGDCTEYPDFITQQPVLIGLGSIAVRQGIAAGINAAGGTYQLPKGVLQTRTSHFQNIEIAAVGPSSNHLQKIPALNAKFTGSSKPDYYPGGKPITMKLYVHKQTKKILAAQAIGDKAAQRINTIAAGMLTGMTVEELRRLETAYAPAISPTLEPETLIGDIITRKLS